MAEHTIQAHFTGASLANVAVPATTDRDIRIINAVAAALGGENASHPMVIFEAAKIYRAVVAIREAEAREAN